jgi:hypothetical protein
MGVWIKLTHPGEPPPYGVDFEMFNPHNGYRARIAFGSVAGGNKMEAQFNIYNAVWGDYTVVIGFIEFNAWHWYELLMDADNDRVELWIDGVLEYVFEDGWEGFSVDMYARIRRALNSWLAPVRFDYWRMRENLEYPPT